MPRPVFAQYGEQRYALRTDRWKIIEDRTQYRVELYDLENDPTETRNLAPFEPRRVHSMLRDLESFRQAHESLAQSGDPLEHDPEHAEDLEALGYL